MLPTEPKMAKTKASVRKAHMAAERTIRRIRREESGSSTAHRRRQFLSTWQAASFEVPADPKGPKMTYSFLTLYEAAAMKDQRALAQATEAFPAHTDSMDTVAVI